MSDARLTRALLSLEGLAVGDAYGEALARATAAGPRAVVAELLPGPWPLTDDSIMAAGLVASLKADGAVVQDKLVARFAERYGRDPGRGYGLTAHTVLGAVLARGSWREAARGFCNGEGSMGNGAAMRVAPLGAWFADAPAEAAAQARLSAEVTHAHPEAAAGAIAVAVAASLATDAPRDGGELLAAVIEATPAGEVRKGLARALELGPSADAICVGGQLGCGMRVSAQDTVPFALWCVASHLHDYAAALRAATACGGDRDTLAAITGGVVVLATGLGGVPERWRVAEPVSAWL